MNKVIITFMKPSDDNFIEGLRNIIPLGINPIITSDELTETFTFDFKDKNAECIVIVDLMKLSEQHKVSISVSHYVSETISFTRYYLNANTSKFEEFDTLSEDDKIMHNPNGKGFYYNGNLHYNFSELMISILNNEDKFKNSLPFFLNN